MDFLPLVTQLLGVMSLVALIWLIIRAFKKHVGWGFAVLLLSPIGATVFGIKYWRDEKKPFLAYISTSSAALALTLYLFSAWGGWELVGASHRVHQGIQTQTLTDEDARAFMDTSLNFIENSGLNIQDQLKLDFMREQLESQFQGTPAGETAPAAPAGEAGTEETAEAGADIKPINKKVKPRRERYRLAYQPIRIADAKNYVGATVKVTRKNVIEKEYRLIGATGNSLELTQRSSGGSYSFKFRTSDIEKIRVLTKQPY
jgi:hypothetical protein